MQATDTATNRDFARKTATAARWAGKALWFVIGSLARAGHALLIGVVTFIVAFKADEDPESSESSFSFEMGAGPAPGKPGHNHFRWNEYHHGGD
ncbi:hypothetical protein [Gilvimarinus chinensis]|uniref:hypothetical protein n=1 Tax=Gilvimarinus chinensis TaxID=396005 RepID=UPI000380F77B|nr:hypothetical protein [Gilvimarinus chinensis]